MRRGSLGVTVLALSMLAGCALAPQPAPAPTLQIPAAWRTTVGPSAAAEADWWKGFGDLALNALVDAALTGNNDMRVAATRVREFQARLRIAEAGRLPTLDANVTLSRASALNSAGSTTLANSFQGGLQAAYEIDLWGRLESLVEAARADYEAQQAAQLGAMLSVAASAASAYITLRGLDAQLELARATLVSRTQSLQLARDQFRVGYSSRLELNQAEAEYRATTAMIPQLLQSIARQENALSVLTGANPGPITRGPSLTEMPLPPVPEGLPSDLLRRRPDIRQAEQAIVAADASLAAARDQLLPAVRLSASVGRQGFSLSQLLDAPNRLWSVGGSILAPLFEGGRLRAQADVAAAQRDRAIYLYENTVRTAFSEVENALSALLRLKEQATELEARQVAAAEALRVVHNRYRNGYASYLEELDAQRTLYSVQVNLIQARTNLLTAQVDLYRALGGGWQLP
ncbi:efflux transporter outer membrane subunit [Noviherbaspirillum massiliense]|uniref:efflux transporter outer membrane subunit n=1 Tax=Noviherbaspirillum massiliense TaxID=1465823 RepID=UPI0003042947|nr:efflux transporter outer membrane subunit [Noviherbaspirillum massiliense]